MKMIFSPFDTLVDYLNSHLFSYSHFYFLFSFLLLFSFLFFISIIAAGDDLPELYEGTGFQVRIQSP